MKRFSMLGQSLGAQGGVTGRGLGAAKRELIHTGTGSDPQKVVSERRKGLGVQRTRMLKVGDLTPA
jgi:hypothetical protein